MLLLDRDHLSGLVNAPALSAWRFLDHRADRGAMHRLMSMQPVRPARFDPGMTAAYVLEDGTVGTAASGLADVEANLPMTDNTRMLSASIGKSFVGALCLALAIEGRLDLDEPVSRWIGTFDWFQRMPNHESITLRHLLTHSAGIPDHVHTWTPLQKRFQRHGRKQATLSRPSVLSNSYWMSPHFSQRDKDGRRSLLIMLGSLDKK